MKRRFSERWIVASLVALLVIESALLLLHLGVLSFKKRPPGGGQAAGQIVRAQNQLRRRGVNSLVWDKVENDETVYYHDSILTLKQSTATLQLDQQTEVSLSENTLVTIEPPDEREYGEIRLKFIKGNLAARNPFHPTQISGEEWTVDVRQGSDVEFRQVDGADFELQVKKGGALFKAAGGSEKQVGTSELLRIDGNQTQTFSLDSQLAWSKPPPPRIYTHADSVRVDLAWQGHAQELILQTLGVGERRLPVAAGEQRRAFDLASGQYRIFLRGEGRSSEPLNLQIWHAPLIHLLKPLPRDRVRTDSDIYMVWTRSPDVRRFQVDFGGHDPADLKTDGDNTAHARFDQPADLQWSVKGFDADGFEIPPLYTYPIYVREDPLAPPRLKAPQLRRPASRGDDRRGAAYRPSIWHWLFPVAAAEEPAAAFEAVFEWEPVEGADQYVLEISATADFREPVVTRSLSRSRFVWRGFKPQPYYWRVAAGTKSGRMGIFSEPAMVNLQEAMKGGDEREVDGVMVRAIAPVAKKVEPPAEKPTEPSPVPEPRPAAAVVAPPAVPTPAVAPPAVVASPPPPPEPAPSVPPPSFHRLVAWRPVYQSLLIKGQEQVHGRLRGGTVTGVAVEYPWRLRDDALLQLSAVYQSTVFRPEPQPAYPFQDQVRRQDVRIEAIYYKTWWGYGLQARQLFALKRTGNESVRAESTPALGPVMGASRTVGAMQWRAHLGLVAGSAVAGDAGVDVRFHIWNHLTVGFGVEQQQTSLGSSLSEGSALFGFDF